ncbi:MAG: hypothetical protein HY046_11265 [Acidobacteria bacterium]|nr:hypothetical protein [Acidobacteriota bacterium]
MDDMKNSDGPLKATVVALPDSERRNKGRAKLAQPIRVRPSEPSGHNFDEVLVSLNVCRDGVYFPTEQETYYKGMRVFITFPYNEGPGAINMEYIGEVVRIDQLSHGRKGIAVHLKMKVNLGSHTTFR